MTVPVGVLVQVVLMVLVGGEEVAQRRNLRHNRLFVQFLFLIKNAFDNRQLNFVRVIDTRTVACAHVMPLPVGQRRVESVEEHVKQKGSPTLLTS